MRVLKDGSDSVGTLGALNRVYLNIGLFSEEWLLHFNAVAGGKPISPIEIALADRQARHLADGGGLRRLREPRVPGMGGARPYGSGPADGARAARRGAADRRPEDRARRDPGGFRRGRPDARPEPTGRRFHANARPASAIP
jgi:hypothetical protein